MDAKRCPYLGLPDDPDTRLDFPSPGNVCHKADPPGPIKTEYQHHTCLTGQHVGCPIYTAAKPIPVPANILARAPRTGITSRMPAMGRLPVAAVLLALLGLIMFALVNSMGTAGQSSSAEEDGGEGNDRSGMFWLPRTGENRRTATPNPTIMQFQTSCPMPDDWVTYTVNPTDSLYRLSVVHAVSVKDLQRANCLGNETVILPGQVIYIPFTPTLTPTSTNTAQPFRPVVTQTDPPDDNPPAPPPGEDSPTDAPTTQSPPIGTPTAAPTTAVPPTLAPTLAVTPTSIVPTVGIPTNPVPTLPLPTLALTLPPIFPPTATEPPPDPSDGGNNGRTETIDCGGGPVSVDGNNNDITFTGICLGLVVTGNNNHITVPAGTSVRDLGKNNVIEEG